MLMFLLHRSLFMSVFICYVITLLDKYYGIVILYAVGVISVGLSRFDELVCFM